MDNTNTIIERNGFFSGRICQYISVDEIISGAEVKHDLLYIPNTKNYNNLFKALKQVKDKEIIFECNKEVNIEKLLNECPKREDCFPIIDYIKYKISDKDAFAVSDISNLRMDDIIYCELKTESEYELWRRLAEEYTNCSFELSLTEMEDIRNVYNKLMNEKFSITSRTRILLFK